MYNNIGFTYKLGLSHIAISLCAKHLGLLVDSMLHSHSHVEHRVTQGFKTLGLVCCTSTPSPVSAIATPLI